MVWSMVLGNILCKEFILVMVLLHYMEQHTYAKMVREKMVVVRK